MVNDFLDRTWHLAENDDEIKVTEFELALWQLVHGFIRWQEDCESCVNNTDLTGNDLAVLHIIRMKDRPKTYYEIARLLNREDIFNIKYSIRKLEKSELIRKTPSKDKTATYEITDAGIKNTEDYTKARRAILIELYKHEPGLSLEKITQALIKLKALYAEAGSIAASYRRVPNKNTS